MVLHTTSFEEKFYQLAFDLYHAIVLFLVSQNKIAIVNVIFIFLPLRYHDEQLEGYNNLQTNPSRLSLLTLYPASPSPWAAAFSYHCNATLKLLGTPSP